MRLLGLSLCLSIAALGQPFHVGGKAGDFVVTDLD